MTFEAVDRSMSEIISANDGSRALISFGGKTVVLGGDFRQFLPVVEGGSRAEIVDLSLSGRRYDSMNGCLMWVMVQCRWLQEKESLLLGFPYLLMWPCCRLLITCLLSLIAENYSDD